MSRTVSGPVTKARHKKVIKAAKGYYGARSRLFKTATQAVDKANQYATRDRKVRKRNFRALWIQRINAAVRAHDEALTYSKFINGLSLPVLKWIARFWPIWPCMNPTRLQPLSKRQRPRSLNPNRVGKLGSRGPVRVSRLLVFRGRCDSTAENIKRGPGWTGCGRSIWI